MKSESDLLKRDESVEHDVMKKMIGKGIFENGGGIGAVEKDSGSSNLVQNSNVDKMDFAQDIDNDGVGIQNVDDEAILFSEQKHKRLRRL